MGKKWTYFNDRAEVVLPIELRDTYIRVLSFSESRFRLNIEGIHGRAHWLNVIKNGLFIAQKSSEEMDLSVILLFGLLHDVERRDDGLDPEHGLRSANLMHSLNMQLFELSPHQMNLLVDACRWHNSHNVHENPTVHACWDADRLDQKRVGVKVNPSFLTTAVGRSLKDRVV